MNVHANDLIAASVCGVLMASGVAQDSIEHFPISAGLSGAVIAAVRSTKGPITGASMLKGTSSILAGAAGAIFVAPVVCSEVFGWKTIQAIVFGHFFFGLIGSTLVDLVIDKRTMIAGGIANEAMKRWLGNPACPVPTATPTTVTTTTPTTPDAKS